MTVTCEIHGCTDDAQSKLTTSGYELCARHFGEWSEHNMFVVEEDGKVRLVKASG